MRLSMGRRIEELEKELDKKDIKFQDYKSRTDTSIRLVEGIHLFG